MERDDLIERVAEGYQFLFTESGLVVAKARLRQFDNQHRAVLRQLSGMQGSSAPDDIDSERAELSRMSQCAQEPYLRLQHVIARAVVVPEPTDNAHLVIGTVGTIQRFDVRGNPLGPPKSWLVVGYDEGDARAEPLSKLSYTSPLLDGMLWRKVGAFSEADRNGNYAELVGIDLLSTWNVRCLPDKAA